MAIMEKVTKQIVIKALEPQAITTDTTTAGAIIDCADYDNGIYFAMDAYAYGAGESGDFTLKLEDGDDAALADAAVIPDDQLVYGALPSITAAIAEGGALAKEGVDFTSLDGEDVFILFLLVSPPDRPGDHLRGLENISRHLRNQNFCNFLKQAETKEEVIELLQEADDNQLD